MDLSIKYFLEKEDEMYHIWKKDEGRYFLLASLDYDPYLKWLIGHSDIEYSEHELMGDCGLLTEVEESMVFYVLKSGPKEAQEILSDYYLSIK